jgi:hypothetical protein
MVELLPLAQCQLQKNDLGNDRSGNYTIPFCQGALPVCCSQLWPVKRKHTRVVNDAERLEIECKPQKPILLMIASPISFCLREMRFTEDIQIQFEQTDEEQICGVV